MSLVVDRENHRVLKVCGVISKLLPSSRHRNISTVPAAFQFFSIKLKTCGNWKKWENYLIFRKSKIQGTP
jgi:hypothetical protein